MTRPSSQALPNSSSKGSGRTSVSAAAKSAATSPTPARLPSRVNRASPPAVCRGGNSIDDMKYVRYSRYMPGAAEDIDIYELDRQGSPEQRMDQLREAILRALQEGDLLPPELMEKLLENPDLSQNPELRDLIDQIM